MLSYAGSGQLNITEFLELRKALQEASLMKASVGTVLQGVEFSGDFAPLVAQSIDATWTSETYADEDMVLTNILAEKDVTSPLHEVVTVRDYGQEQTIESFFSEGGLTETEVADLARKITQVKFIGVQRSLTDVASMTGIIGGGMVSRKGLETETRFGIMSLKGRYETALFHADSALSPLHFDGIRSQIIANSPAENVFDQRGKPLSLQDFIGQIFTLADDPNYGKTDVILVPGSILGAMINIATAYGRHDQLGLKGGDRRLVFNAGALSVVGPNGKLIDIKAAPKMNLKRNPPFDIAAGGVTDSTKAPALGGGGVVTATAANPASQFAVEDAGSYYYTLVMVGDKGARQLPVEGPIAVAAGDEVEFTIDDDLNSASGDGSLRYYMVFRSDKDGASSTVSYMTRVARNDAGGGNETIFLDLNADLPKTSDVYALESNPEAIYVAKLLGTIRRPLAEVATAKPFMIMRFCSPHIRHPRKQLLWRNAALSL